MSDETKMNQDLENFEASLREVGAPVSNVDRDQLMYDAGWAAALATENTAQHSPTATTFNGAKKLPSIFLSFASGLAVATAVMLAFIPMGDSPQSNSIVASADLEMTNPARTPHDMFASTERSIDDSVVSDSNSPDVRQWLDDLPANATINARFGLASKTETVEIDNTSVPEIKRPATAQRLLSELLPPSAARQASPTFSAWLIP
jgi:hypothetical protein